MAFVIVLALLTLFGHTLESLPYTLNALVFTGVLVPVMGNLVMPVVSGFVARRLTGPADPMPASRSGERADPREQRVIRESPQDARGV